MATYNNPQVDPRLTVRVALTDPDGTVVPMSGGTVPVSGTVTIITTPTNLTLTNRSGTITLGGTAQAMMGANATRKYLLIQNVDAVNLWFNFTTTAVQTQPSIELLPGQAFTMEGDAVSTEAISVIGPTTSQAYTAKEG